MTLPTFVSPAACRQLRLPFGPARAAQADPAPRHPAHLEGQAGPRAAPADGATPASDRGAAAAARPPTAPPSPLRGGTPDLAGALQGSPGPRSAMDD
jgi:hypothetical protein